MGRGVSLGRGEARPGELLLTVGRRGLLGKVCSLYPLLIPSDVRETSVVEGSDVPKRAELGVPCILASFVGPQRLVQDCPRRRAKSQQIFKMQNIVNTGIEKI